MNLNGINNGYNNGSAMGANMMSNGSVSHLLQKGRIPSNNKCRQSPSNLNQQRGIFGKPRQL